MTSADIAQNNQSPVQHGFPAVQKFLLRQVFKAVGPAPLRFAIKDGESYSPPGISPIATIVIADRRTLAELALDPEVGFGEAYSEGRIEVQGDLLRALEVVYDAWPSGAAERRWYTRLTSQAMRLLQANSLHGSRDNIHRHYDLGNDFYKLWLDRQMLYTCAYFESPSATLEHAQQSKMDYICRKLRLQPGDSVVEAGCGWGALSLHMAHRYGARVRAFNISHEQIVFARERAAQLGLSPNQVEFVEDDYRNISARNKADVFVSVGMLEHVGVENFPTMAEVIHQAIGDTGRGFLHLIGRSYHGDSSRWIRKRIFPGAYAPTLREAMDILERYRYAALDVENLRLHYAKTLEHWLSRFENAGEHVAATYGPWFQGAWRLYLAGSLAAFRTGTLQLFQISFAGSKSEPGDWTRAPLYNPNETTSSPTHKGGGAPYEDMRWTPATS